MFLKSTSALRTTGIYCTYLLVAAQLSCRLVSSKADVIGFYEMGSGTQRIDLEIKSTGVYEEVVTLDGKIADRRSGKWSWGPKFVDFDSLWIPRQFAPEYILQADSTAASGQPKYTLPGHWSLGAESHFGQVLLVVFPDADVHFRMIRHGTN